MGPAKHVTNWTQADYQIVESVDKFPVTALNDMRFEKYQVFRGELRIVPETGAPVQ
jgi:hypothetical protein